MHAYNASCSAVRVSSRRTTVESNMKVYIWLVKTLHNMHLACEASLHNVLFLLHLIWFSFCLLGFFCTLTSLLSLSQCHQPSAAFSTRFHKTCTCTLRRTSRTVLPVLHYQEAPFFPVLDLHHQCTWHEFRAHARECKQWVQIDIPEREGHVRMHAHTLRDKIPRSKPCVNALCNNIILHQLHTKMWNKGPPQDAT